jgi:membrane peptidoglycan carboxypeptidase
VANGGYLMKPRIVRQIEDRDGRAVESSEPTVVGRILEPDTVDILTSIMERVVTDGTGRKAALEGYTVAGKTGTAQKVDASGRYSMIDHVASFVGFVPSSRPALVILASLDEPRGEFNQGGDVAAPLFARIAEKALRHLAVPPEDPNRVIRAVWPPEPTMAATFVSAPATPAWDARALDPSNGPRLMPDLLGRSAREAAIAAARRGLTVELRGSGAVLSQSPAPGTEIQAGMACVLELGRPRAVVEDEAAPSGEEARATDDASARSGP